MTSPAGSLANLQLSITFAVHNHAVGRRTRDESYNLDVSDRVSVILLPDLVGVGMFFNRLPTLEVYRDLEIRSTASPRIVRVCRFHVWGSAFHAREWN